MRFRVWCKTHNKYDENHVTLEQDGRLSVNGVIIDEKHYDVERSTGLKDANGNEIFEGDIVEGTIHSHWSHGIIRCIVAWNVTSACFECRRPVPNCEGRYWSHKVKFSKDVKVIGNLHEIELADIIEYLKYGEVK